MKKISNFLVFSLALFLGGCSLTTTETTTTTTSSDSTDPVEVYTVEDLQNIEMTDDVELMADLDLTDLAWTPLGTYDEPYSGVFHGNNHTISNMSILTSNDDYNGLFGVISGEVSDLIITSFNIDYTTSFVTYAGGLAGSSTADISNVVVDGSISVTNASSSSYVGLLVGESSAYVTSDMTVDEFVSSVVEENSATGDIYVNSEFFAYVGGLIGKSYNSELFNNDVVVDLVVSTDIYRSYVGGLVGHHYGGVLIGYEDYVDSTDLYIDGNVAISDIEIQSDGTSSSIGSLIGYSQYGVITNNFALSTITASGIQLYIGSLIGEDWRSTIDKSVSIADFNITEEDGQILMLSSVIGFASGDESVDNSYFYVTSNTTFDQVLGDSLILGDITNDELYSNTLGWSSEWFSIEDYSSYLPTA